MIDGREWGGGFKQNRLKGAYIIVGERGNKHTQISYFQTGINAMEQFESYA